MALTSQWGPLNKMIPLIEDSGGGGGCTVTPLGPWTNISPEFQQYFPNYRCDYFKNKRLLGLIATNCLHCVSSIYLFNRAPSAKLNKELYL